MTTTPSDRSLKARVVDGFSWVMIAHVTTSVLELALTILLARLLLPAEFGLLAMVAVFTGFAALFSDVGFTVALVQRKTLDERHRSSVFWLTLGAGALLSLLTFVAAPLVAEIYGRAPLTLLTRWIAPTFVLAALNHVQMALLQRDMQFRRLVIIDGSATAAGGATAVGMALAGYGVWSLVGQELVKRSVAVIATWLTSRWVPSLLFDRGAIADLWRFSAHLVGTNVFGYWSRNADNFLIGRYTDAVSLGFYTRAYALMMLPLEHVTRLVSRALFPALARMQDDPPRLKAVILRAQRAIGFVTTPVMSGLAVLAAPVVAAVFGPAWAGMVPIVQILSVVAICQATLVTNGWMFHTTGRTDLQLRWSVFSGLVMLASFAIGVRWGAVGVAAGYAVAYYALWYPAITYAGRLIGLRFGEYLRNQADVLAMSAVMVAVVWGTGRMLPLDWGHWPILAVQVPLATAVYLSLAAAFRPAVLRDLLSLRQPQPA